MPRLGMTAILTAGLLALGITVLTLRGNLVGDDPPPASLTEPASHTQLTATPRDPRPRVLHAKPVTPGDSNSSPVTSPYVSPLEAESPAAPGAVAPIPITPEIAHEPAAAAPDISPASIAPLASEPNRGEVITEPETSPLPVAAAFDEPQRVVTGENDSFWSISERMYGSGAYYRALFRHNRTHVLRPDQLRPGIPLEVPPLSTLRELYADDCPPLSPDNG